MSEVNQIQRAAIGWKVLTDIANTENKLIRYGELGDKIGIHHRPVRFVLGVIQDYCLKHQLPPLTILVVNESGEPGNGFIAWDIENKEEAFERVYNYNWKNLENPFSYALNGITESEIINELLDKPDNSKDVYGKIKVRGIAQQIFRKALLKAYDKKCAFCEFSFVKTLQASHIIPWSKSTKSERLDVRNGILLCANHHSLFDQRKIIVNSEYEIIYDDPTGKNKHSEYDKILTIDLHKKRMKLPKNENHKPNLGYLNKHKLGFK